MNYLCNITMIVSALLHMVLCIYLLVNTILQFTICRILHFGRQKETTRHATRDTRHNTQNKIRKTHDTGPKTKYTRQDTQHTYTHSHHLDALTRGPD